MTGKCYNFSCTKILKILVFFGSMVDYTLRSNHFITLMETTDFHHFKTDKSSILQLNNDEKKYLVEIFLFGYAVSSLVGGRLSELYGPKLTYGIGLLLGSLIHVCVPQAACVHFYFAFTLRFLGGMAFGIIYPSIFTLASRWIPPTDRSKFMSNLLSYELFTIILIPLFGGNLAPKYGWHFVFYLTGFLGILFSVVWLFLIYDTPNQHPRISLEEKSTITDNIGPIFTKNKPKSLPIRDIFFSLPVWAVVVAHSATNMANHLVLSDMSHYSNELFVEVYIPVANIGVYATAILSGMTADKLINYKKLSTLDTRKFFVALTLLVPGALMVLYFILRKNFDVHLKIFILLVILYGFVSSGHLPNSLEISPNYCGTIMGIANSFATILPVVYRKTLDSYYDFLLLSIYFIGGLFFIVFGRSDVQKWNHDDEDSTSIEEPVKMTNRNTSFNHS